jgi:thiamine kinase-like enzyme
MQWLDGPTMLADLGKHPNRLMRYAGMLAGLHNAVHAVAGPPWASSFIPPGDCLVHVDLHPDNVLLTADGPMIIDWSRSGNGNAADDVAIAWLVISTSNPHGSRYERALAKVGQRMFGALFLRGVDARPSGTDIAGAIDRRLQYAILEQQERVRMQRLLSSLRK